jgi:hypothetical protein
LTVNLERFDAGMGNTAIEALGGDPEHPVYRAVRAEIAAASAPISQRPFQRPSPKRSCNMWVRPWADMLCHTSGLLADGETTDPEGPWKHLAEALSLVDWPGTNRPGQYQLPLDVEDVVEFCMLQGVNLSDWREERVKKLHGWARRLQHLDSELRADFKERGQRPEHVEKVTKKVHITLLACFVDALSWPDKLLPLHFMIGFPAVNEIRDTKLFAVKEPTQSLQAFREGFKAFEAGHRAAETRLRKQLLQQMSSADGRQKARLLMSKTKEEIELGYMGKFMGRKQFHELYGGGDGDGARPATARVIGRFAVQQTKPDGSVKVRVVDNAKASGTNQATRTVETLRLPDARVVPQMAACYWAVAQRLSLPVPALAVSCDDIKAAYKRIPTRDLRFTMCALCNPAVPGEILYAPTWGSAFGMTSSVLSFNSLAELLTFIAKRTMALVVEHYVDDTPQVDAVAHAESGQAALTAMHAAFGIPLEPTKAMAPRAKQTVLGMEVDVSGAHDKMDPVVRLAPSPWRCEKLLAWMEGARRADYLPPGEASRLMGKLNWILRAVYRSVGRTVCRPFYRRSQGHDGTDDATNVANVSGGKRKGGEVPPNVAGGAGGSRGDKFTPGMERSMRFLRPLLHPGNVPEVRFRPSDKTQRRGVVYSDAMWKGGRKQVGVIGLILVLDMPDGSVLRRSAEGRCPPWLLARIKEAGGCDRGGSDMVINELEFLGMLCAHLTFGHLLRGCSVLHFGDNTTALSAAVSGRAESEAMRRMVLHYALAVAEEGSEIFVDWVPSKANVADIPSRPDEQSRASLRAHGFLPMEVVWPLEGEWDFPEGMLERLRAARR